MFVEVCYLVVIFSQLAFACLAVFLSFKWQKILVTESVNCESVEFFITARKTQGQWRIGWSFFAGAMGSWAIIGPPNYACYAGIIGLLMYGLSSGAPIFAVAVLGDIVQHKWPECGCIGDFVRYRFGPVFAGLVELLTFFNMSVAITAELTAIGSLFKDFVGSVNYPIILVVGLTTTAYTCYGGLHISIVTDQFQAWTSLALIAVLAASLALTFRDPLPPDFGRFGPGGPDNRLGPNAAGYSSVAVMPLCLTASTVFSEALWQRVWAAESPAALRRGGAIGAASVAAAVLFFGLCGLLAAWSGRIDFADDPARDPAREPTNPNLYLFQLFRPAGAADGGGGGMGVVILVLAAVMNMGAVDSLQNGVAATVAARFLRGRPIAWTRAAVAAVTVPAVVAAAYDLQVSERPRSRVRSVLILPSLPPYLPYPTPHILPPLCLQQLHLCLALLIPCFISLISTSLPCTPVFFLSLTSSPFSAR